MEKAWDVPAVVSIPCQNPGMVPFRESPSGEMCVDVIVLNPKVSTPPQKVTYKLGCPWKPRKVHRIPQLKSRVMQRHVVTMLYFNLVFVSKESLVEEQRTLINTTRPWMKIKNI